MTKSGSALEQLQIANVPTKGTICTNRAPITLSVKNRKHSLQFTEHLTRLHTYIHTTDIARDLCELSRLTRIERLSKTQLYL